MPALSEPPARVAAAAAAPLAAARALPRAAAAMSKLGWARFGFNPARRQSARGGAGALPASGWCVCTGCSGARAVSPAFGGLAPGGGGLGAAGAGLNAPWEGFARRRGAGAAFASELPYPSRRRVDFRRTAAASERCVARLDVPTARRGGFRVGATWRGVAGLGGAGAPLASEWRVRTGSFYACVVALAV